MHTITKAVDRIITKGAQDLVTKGGSFNEAIRMTVEKAQRKFPQADGALLFRGFEHRWKGAVSARASL